MANDYLGVPTYQPNPYGGYQAQQPYNPYNPNFGANRPMMPNNGNNYSSMAQPSINGMQNQQNNQQSQQGNSNVNWVYVPNIEAVQQILVVPNQTLYIMNQNKSEFYIKSTDSMGIATTKVCPFAVYDLNDYQQKQQSETAQTSEFVTRNEYDNLVSNVSNQFAALQQNISNISMQLQQPQPQQAVMVQQVPVQQQHVETQAVTTSKKKKQDKDVSNEND